MGAFLRLLSFREFIIYFEALANIVECYFIVDGSRVWSTRFMVDAPNAIDVCKLWMEIKRVRIGLKRSCFRTKYPNLNPTISNS